MLVSLSLPKCPFISFSDSETDENKPIWLDFTCLRILRIRLLKEENQLTPPKTKQVIGKQVKRFKYVPL